MRLLAVMAVEALSSFLPVAASVLQQDEASEVDASWNVEMTATFLAQLADGLAERLGVNGCSITFSSAV